MYRKLQTSGLYLQINNNNMSDFSTMKESKYYARMLLACHSMPVLLKMKPSNLLSINKNIFWKDDLIKELELEIMKFGCNSFIPYEDDTLVNYLVYNEAILRQLLAIPENENFLISHGYQSKGDRVKDTLATLKFKFSKYHNQMKDTVDFPHEIGIILGYPVKDVDEFIRCSGNNYILNGGWKVYHNAEEAIKKFEQFKIIRQYAIKMVNDGKDLMEMSNYGKYKIY